MTWLSSAITGSGSISSASVTRPSPLVPKRAIAKSGERALM